MTRVRPLFLALLGIAIAAYLVADRLGFMPPPPEPTYDAAPVGAPPADVAAAVRLEVVARDLDQPLDLRVAPGDRSGRLFVVEKTGRVRLLRPGGKVDPAPFLDLSKRVSIGSEQGLLGLAFHPKYAENGRFFVNFTDRKGDTRVVEMRVSKESPDRADPASEREILFVDQPFANHNGGNLVFRPADGRLYVGLGDGGLAGDPFGNGQDPKALLGKMLRLDVDAAPPQGAGGRPFPEIWQIGLRNPWRYSFDRKTGDLYIADVGQNRWEEVDVVPASSKGGENFGWSIVEGLGHCFRRRGCDQSGLVQPVVEYDHNAGCSITGGFVYRGKALPEIDGCYFYADYCTALVRSFRWKDGKVSDSWEWRPVLDPGSRLASISSFGEDADGELYILSLDGPIYKLARAPALR